MLRTTDTQSVVDARLHATLGTHTLAELIAVQHTLQRLHRDGNAVDHIASALQRDSAVVAQWLSPCDRRDDEDKVLLLLGALAVAIAWHTYRARPASADDLLYAFERIESGVSYTLPIPRHKPCFCGSEDRYRDCHGRPPMAAA